MSITAVTGAQWGDEGKGKFVDLLAPESEYVLRYHGGNNAGHTIRRDGLTRSLHLIPSGIYAEKQCILGGGMVINPLALCQEIGEVKQDVPDVLDLLLISRDAHLILPYHGLQDAYAEEAKGAAGARQIGTTRRGIGPAYADKAFRNGLRMNDLLRPDFRERLAEQVSRKNDLFRRYYERPEIDLDEIWRQIEPTIEILVPLIKDTTWLMRVVLNGGHRVLAEGAQGVLLDIDSGTYPYVTSSHTGVGSLLLGTGIRYSDIKSLIGVAKGYVTRVGNGPFPTEQDNVHGGGLRERGGEYGTTTGRPRRCGWLDLPLLRYAVELNGFTEIALTKVDVLDTLSGIPICLAHRYPGVDGVSAYPDMTRLEEADPVYEILPGWETSTRNCRREKDLPPRLREYIEFIFGEIGVPITLVSVGPDAAETVALPSMMM